MRRYITPPPESPKITLGRIPRGYRGTGKTIEHMMGLIRQGVKDFYVRQKAIDILLEKGVKPKDYLGEIKALFEWVQRNVRYTKDPFRLEVLHSARRMLELRAGDCDDMSILLGAMLEAIGHPVRLVIVGPDPLRPHLFTHVYLEVFYKGRWIPLDATMPHAMGWAPRALVKKVIPAERRSIMFAEDMELQGLDATPAVPDWLRSLLRAIRGQAIRPKDERVRQLWNLLRQRQVLSRSPRTKRLLHHIWDKGLAARPRPITTQRLVRRLRRLGILPAGAMRPITQGTRSIRPSRPLALRPVRPVAARPLRPVAARPVTARPVTAPRR